MLSDWPGSAEAFGEESRERAVVEGGVHPGRDLAFVEFPELAPVHRRAEVVGGVVAGVDEKKICSFPGQVSGVVVFGFAVAILMLEEIHANQNDLRADPWQEEEKEGGAPVRDEEGHDRRIENDPLDDRLSIKARAFRFPIGEIAFLPTIHRGDGDEGEEQDVERVAPEAHQASPHEIQLALRVLVMAYVVGGDDACRRLADGEGQSDLVNGIPQPAAENRQVHLVVRGGAGDEGKQAAERDAQEVAENPRPVSGSEKQGDQDEKQRPDVRSVAKQGQESCRIHACYDSGRRVFGNCESVWWLEQDCP